MSGSVAHVSAAQLLAGHDQAALGAQIAAAHANALAASSTPSSCVHCRAGAGYSSTCFCRDDCGSADCGALDAAGRYGDMPGRVREFVPVPTFEALIT